MSSLTNPNIKTAQPGDVLRDEKVVGLHMRVTNERKAFYLYFRTRAGKERRPKIGDHPTITLDKAREIAREWLEVVAAGKDPVQQWADQAAMPTIAGLCDEYEKRHLPKKKQQRHDREIIRNHILPHLGGKKVADVKVTDIEDLHRKLEKTPYMANRVLACLSKMMNLAEKWEMRPQHSNPCQHVDKFREAKRKRYLRPEEAVEVYKRLVYYGDTYPEQAAFLWLLIYTGARPAEIASAKASQRRGNRFELAEHKTDRTGETRIIFLPPQAVDVLDGLRRTKEGTVTGVKSPRHLWRKILADADFDKMGRSKADPIADLRMYDLRHSFASAGLMAGLSLDQIGELLGHASPETTKRYAHLMEEMGVAKATQAADFMESLMTRALAKKEERKRPCDASSS